MNMNTKHLNSKDHTDNYIKIAVISNISFEPCFRSLLDSIFFSQYAGVSLLPVNLSECVSNSVIHKINDADLIAIIPNMEAMFQDLRPHFLDNNLLEKQIKDILVYLENIHSKIQLSASAPIIWFGFEDYYTNLHQTTGNTIFQNGFAERINSSFAGINDTGFVFIDTKRIIAQIGIDNAYDLKNKYRWNSPYSKRMIESIYKELFTQHAIYVGKTKKCLVLDCDNVLWGGIVAEDGIENIRLSSSGLGRMYRDFQLFVLELYNRGVILAICSKNNPNDVLTVFREHSEMVLKEKNIACFYVNWNDKPGNIRGISKELNIGLDSIVFVDDSPEEIAAVKALLPEVTSIRFYRGMDYSLFSCFNLKNCVDISVVQERNETYRTNKQREELKLQFKRSEDYVRALNIHTDIHRALPVEYSRISELTQRTNKCTNGVRFTVRDIKESIEDKSFELYSVHVSDRFSDFGLVGAFAIEDDTLVLFSLSCRALGKSVESLVLNYIVSQWRIKSFHFYSTNKNDDIKKLFEERFSV